LFAWRPEFAALLGGKIWLLQLAAYTEKERQMAYIEGAYEVRPGDPVDVRCDGRPLEGAVVTRIGRMGMEVKDAHGASIVLDFRMTNEAIWDRGRKYLEEQAGAHEPAGSSPALTR
jgi:hypothetical protein